MIGKAMMAPPAAFGSGEVPNRYAEPLEYPSLPTLASGSAGSFDEYRYQVGYLEALTRVLDICREIEKEFYGSRPGEGETATGES